MSVIDNNQKNQQQKMIEQFQKFYDIYQNVADYIAIDAPRNDYILSKKNWIERLEQEEFPVAFLGTFSAGKSTTINAILKRDILPEHDKSTTAFPTIIRKGDKDQATIHYLSGVSKYQLRGDLVKELGKEINEESLAIDKDPAFFDKLDEKIRLYESQRNIKINREAYNKLKQLRTGWDNIKENERVISIEEAKRYNEEHPESLFIERIEIQLENIELPKDIVLVDLPGLNVTNARHIKVTEDYIKEKAKAFVVCTDDKMLEGQEIELLDKVNRNNPTVLKRSFWLINKMDSLGPERKRRIEELFYERVNKYNFVISPEKIFKVSSQNYALLAHIADGTLENTDTLKKHIGELDKIEGGKEAKDNPAIARELMNTNPEVAAFIQFQARLFDYLNTTAKEEFVSNARYELIGVVSTLMDIVLPSYQTYQQCSDNNHEKIAFSIEVNKLLEPFLKLLIGNAKEMSDSVLSDISKKELWGQDAQSNLISELKRIVAGDADEITKALRRGTDVDINMFRLPAIIDEKLMMNDYWRKSIVDAVDNAYMKAFQARFLDKLLNSNRQYLPEVVVNGIRERLNGRDIAMRLYGLADGILYQFTEEFKRIVWEEIKPNHNEQQAIGIFKDKIAHFVEHTLAKELNENIWRSVKNHAQYLEREIIELIEKHQNAIHEQIARTAKLSDQVEREIQKAAVIKREYAQLVELRNEL